MKYIICVLIIVFSLYSCNNTGKPSHSDESRAAENDSAYTCPMPTDSVFSSKPGKCPKCGMDLIKNEHHHKEEGLDLNALLKPTNEFVISTMPLTTMQPDNKEMKVEALGIVDYDTRQTGNISARVSGRIEKLYVRYKFQKVSQGQKVMDIYSPELMEAQQNLLFLLKNDAANSLMINAAKQKLLLLGMSDGQLRSIIKRGKPDFTVSIFSSYSGHIHEAGGGSMGKGPEPSNAMAGNTSTSIELSLKEGMYVQKGQTVFNVFNPAKSWISLNIFSEDVPLVKIGQPVSIIPEVDPDKKFIARIGFIEPFFRPGSKTLSVRIYFDNKQMKLPIGSQVKSEIVTSGVSGNWIPKQSVISLGLTKVVFKKTEGGFIVNKVETGTETGGYVEVLNGIQLTDSIARNAQYLMDSESFVRIKNN